MYVFYSVFASTKTEKFGRLEFREILLQLDGNRCSV